MKKSFVISTLSLITAVFISCSNKSSNKTGTASQDSSALQTVRVGVFDGYGGAQTCIWEALAACALDKDMDVKRITTSDIASGVLNTLDAIVIPGGGGSRQYQNLGQENINRIKEFVYNGGGAVGICAGAYLFSNTPNYTCMKINGAQAIDLEHDNRGHGISAFSLTAEGKEIFKEYADIDTLYCMYYEGPVFITAPEDSIQFTEFATMLSDVHEEGGAPSNMTNNRPFFIGGHYGKGKVFSSIAHPEATPGKMWMIARMVRWCVTEKENVHKLAEQQRFSSSPTLKDASLANKEILMSVEDLKKEKELYQKFLYGTPEDKLEAMQWLKEHYSWDAKRWIQGMLFDADPMVRAGAAEYIADIHYFTYLNDVAALYESESNTEAKQRIEQAYSRLKSLLP